VHYERDKTPWLASRLQDFFGMRETPRICRRPICARYKPQQTSPVSGQRFYLRLRRELSRRYPKHAWPEQP
jgi:ATP-dependent helicase HrpB